MSNVMIWSRYLIYLTMIIQDSWISGKQLFFFNLREFISGLSLLTRSDIKEKLKLLFYIYDKDKKKYLNRLEM